MSVITETSQPAMEPYAAVAVVGSVLYARIAVCREALVVKVADGGGGDGNGGGGEGDNGGSEGDGGEGEGGGGDGERSTAQLPGAQPEP